MILSITGLIALSLLSFSRIKEHLETLHLFFEAMSKRQLKFEEMRNTYIRDIDARLGKVESHEKLQR